LVTLPATRAELGRWNAVMRTDLAGGAWTSATQEASRRLYSALVEPVAEPLAESLVLVPDGELHGLPWAALTNPRSGRYLVEERQLATAPSASVYLAARELAMAGHGREPESALVLADPAFDPRLFQLEPLPGARGEGRAVAAAYTAADLRVATGATAGGFLADVATHDVVHFAGHTLADEVLPRRSALVLAAGEGDEAATVTAAEIARRPLRGVRVVVLSACSSDAGPLARGEGPLSLARAFLAAGVPSVVATDWPILDGRSAPLMAQLHRGLARGVEPAQALRQAQLSLLSSRDPDLRSPVAWAAVKALGG
jgi:CHAT domain-containing protein